MEGNEFSDDSRYQKLSTIKYTSTGKVMKIRDTLHDTIVLIKKIDLVGNLCPSWDNITLMNEFITGRSIDHPCFSRMFEIKTQNNNVYIIQE